MFEFRVKMKAYRWVLIMWFFHSIHVADSQFNHFIDRQSI